MEKAQLKKNTILLAEDDEFLQRMYATKLAGSGFEVLVASDGEKALALIKKNKPDVVLLDILMPKMDGFAVLEAVKTDPGTKSIPVILLTNLSEVSDIKKARKLGANDYLIKSHFLPSEVIKLVDKYIK